VLRWRGLWLPILFTPALAARPFLLRADDYVFTAD
jgi:hypothetical protein